MKRVRYAALALVLMASMIAVSAAVAQVGISVSVSVKPLCAPEFSHELRIIWRVTGFSGGGEVAITLIMPDGKTHNFKPNTAEGSFAAPVSYPQGGRVQLQIKATTSGGSASGSGSATLGPCRERARPTIRLNIPSGIAGTPFQASGTGVPGSPRVRLVWRGPSGTETLGEAPVDPQGNYSAPFQIPPNAPEGKGHVCAVETGNAFGRFICADFEVKPTPPGSVEGTVKDPTGGSCGSNARVQVDNLLSQPVAQTTSDSAGRFRIGNLKPGKYRVTAFKAGCWFPVEPFDVKPGQPTTQTPTFNPSLFPLIPGCKQEEDGVRVKSVRASLDGNPDEATIGTFISLRGRSVPVMNTLKAEVERGTNANPSDVRVQFKIESASGQRLWEQTVEGEIAEVILDMSELPPGKHKLTVSGLKKASLCVSSLVLSVQILEDRWFKDWVRDPQVSWIEGERRYQFKGKVPPMFSYGWEPTFSGVDEDLREILRKIFRKSEVASDIVLEETFHIRGTFDAKAEAVLKTTVLGFDLSEKKKSLHVVSTNPPVYALGPVEVFSKDSGHVPIYYQGAQAEVDLFLWSGTIGYGFEVYAGVRASVSVKVEIGAERDLKVQEVRFQPAVDPYLGAKLWADAVIASASANAEGHGYFGVPFVYRHARRSFDIERPCIGFYLPLKLEVDIPGPNWKWSKTYSWDDPKGCMPKRSRSFNVEQEQPEEALSVLAMPAISVDESGRALAVWIQDQDPDPNVLNPEVVFSVYDGSAWSAPRPLTNNDRFETDPQIVSLDRGRALAVWTQNELPRSRWSEQLSLDDVLNSQELYYAVWDGQGWSTPARLTNDNRPDGRVALAGDPISGRALAAWVHDEDGKYETHGDWEIYTSWWDGKTWSAPTALHANLATADMQPSVAIAPDGRAIAVWVHNRDLSLRTNKDRRLALALWDGQRWGAPEEPRELPAGALVPSLTLDTKGQPLIVFSVRGEDEQGRPLGLGQFDYLWSAYRRDGIWEVAPIGEQTAVERPQVRINAATNQATALFREFGDPGTVFYVGKIATATANLNEKPLRWSNTGYLANDAALDWQIAFAQDPKTLNALVLQVKESSSAKPSMMTDSIAQRANTATHVRSFVLSQTSQGSAVTALTVPHGTDLAITSSEITFSDDHPLPGQPVKVTATIRNLGTATVSNPFVVRFVLDPDASGNGMEIGRRTVTTPMPFNAAIPVAIDWTSPGGLHNIQAVVDTDSQIKELNENNNSAIQRTGLLKAPTDLTVSAEAAENALKLRWKAPNTVNISGYRVYRSLTAGGPYELVGESKETNYTDAQIEYEKTYYYVVRTYDAYDIQSPNSDEASGKATK